MVLSNRRTKKSAQVLKEALDYEGYEGLPINFGCSELLRDYGDVWNSPEAVYNAVNKGEALKAMKIAEIPTPLVGILEAYELVNNGERVIGRKEQHSKGRGFFMCRTTEDIDSALHREASHFLKYIEDAREFRVHIVNGQSIKISEKVFPEGLSANRRNVRFGATFQYPEDFNHKKTLRRLAKEATECLGLDFGAVDILWSDEPYVIEVNTAPCLTDDNSDTLERYVRAFVANQSPDSIMGI